MDDNKTILVSEHGWLIQNCKYNDVQFTEQHKNLLAQYLTQNSRCGYYTVYYDRIQFSNYVGVLKVGDLSIEVLPKTAKHNLDNSKWQQLLIDMLAISLRVRAKTTTHADVHVRQFTVLETYMQLFLQEAQVLLRQGLVKKYRTNISNQTALKGKLLIHQNISKNLVHAERFYLSHQVYDRDNVYNSILVGALKAVRSIASSASTVKTSEKLLIEFPECRPVKVSDKVFKNLKYDRKTERYKMAVELARIILLNYHPDLRGGNNNILAIMFDMNVLWETYIYAMLTNAAGTTYEVREQDQKQYWRHPERWILHLRPDLVVIKGEEIVVLDTKWKYLAETEITDVRQMYAYGHYYSAKRRYLLYPGNNGVEISDGYFYDVAQEKFSQIERCGLIYTDPIAENGILNQSLGKDILRKLFVSEI